ncbi:DNA polymerase III subunit beta [Candidatus Anaplasma sp. TIGMIC]|uniref:DNA polymerase III subunit beta n=1 Tax=Candidatus Anaplasma sp. TIGMIC TaxID=3020713 RepID=UPI00232C74E8|nr:DNA polymerase III subunit beta [Candidatus Anaplasma sp. TIGMIC]MDB1135527.1 DNA polymerase III subunit beta [Candidatus Anaplasma sp. TIGMIC]
MGCKVDSGLEFSIGRDDLLQALNYVSSVIERRNSIAVLSCVKIVARGAMVELASTDLDISIEACVQANVVSDGIAVASAQLLYDIVRKLSGDTDVRFRIESGKLLVECGNARFFLHTMAPEKFPAIDGSALDYGFEISAASLAELLNKTKFSMSVEESRYNLRGVYMHIDKDTLYCVATDGHRLSLAKIDKPEGIQAEVGVIIPRKTVSEVLKIISHGGGETPQIVTVGLSSRKICFRYRGYFMVSKVLDGTFPDYASIIQTERDKSVVMDAGILQSAVDRVSVVVFDKVKAIKLSFSPGRLVLSSASTDQGDASEELAIEYEGEDVSIGLNARYLMEVLGSIKGMCELVFSEASAAVLIQDGEHGVHVIMPMRI